VQAFENLGSARARTGDFEGAIAEYNQAIQLDPKDFGAFEMRALTKQSKGDFEEHQE
jgi:Tfp pilus assembly protein PilF